MDWQKSNKSDKSLVIIKLLQKQITVNFFVDEKTRQIWGIW